MVVLGVAFFSGVRAAEPDMRLSVDQFLQQEDYMDLRVISTLGLTDADVAAITDVPGVTRAEGAWKADVLCDFSDTTAVLECMSLTESMNDVTLEQGRLPQKSVECFADRELAKKYGLSVGDQIKLYSGTGDDIKDTLKETTYTVSGIGTWPGYLTYQRGTASIGNGSVSGFIMLPQEAFAQETYTQVFVRTEGLDAKNTYSDAYKDGIEEISEEIKSIAGSRCEIRLADLQSEITDGQNELDEHKKDLADGETKLKDAKQELAKAQKTSEQKLNTAQKELNDGKQKLAVAKKTYETNRQKLLSAQKTIQENQQKLADGRKKLDAAQKEYQDGRAQADAGKQKLDQAGQQLAAGKRQLADAQQKLSPHETQDEQLLKQQKEYQGKMEAYEKSLKEWEASDADLKQAKKQLDAQEAAYTANKKKLDQAQAQTDRGLEQLAQGKKTLKQQEEKLVRAEKELADGRKEAAQKLSDGQKKIEKSEKKLQKARKKIARAEQKLADGQKEIDDLGEGKWYVLSREANETYAEFDQDADRIASIGKVFPVIFFLVAALVSLTTMTRMVEEERGQIGLLKALGYSKGAILAKYAWYAFLATFSGSVTGVLIGEKLLPYVIITAYGMMYDNLQVIAVPYNLKFALMASAAAIGCNLAATFAACYGEMRSTPAALMRPAAPKQGKKILLERIGCFWKRLNFSQKAALRNLFRYKKRLFMTIFGIGGCMALLLIGFGLRDSITAIVDKQFGKVMTYDMSADLDEETSTEEKQKFLDMTGTNPEISDFMRVHLSAMDVSKTGGGDEKSVNVMAPVKADEDKFASFIHLQDRKTQTPYELSDDWAIVTEKLAKLLDLSVGDSITLKDSEEHAFQIRVASVTENYLHHYIYLSPKVYEKVFGEEPMANYAYFRFKEDCSGYEQKFAEQMLSCDMVKSVSSVAESKDTVSYMMDSLTMVTAVLIIAAGLLAFVVIYNLNNINITERKRELATLKVLGFYDGEVAAYVYRENIFLTIFGIVAGVFLGVYLHGYIIQTAETDMIMFGRQISLSSYLFSMLLTAVFAWVVNTVMYFSLKKIDMIESLKSVE